MAAADRHGVVGVAGFDLALPLDAFAEVLPWPEAFTPLVEPAPASLGLMDLRGQALEVLDARSLLSLDGPPPVRRLVAVLHAPQGRIGLAIDDVRGMRHIPRERVQERTAGAPGAPAARVLSVLRDGDAVTHVLDVAALLAVPGVAALREATGMARAATGGQARRFAVFEAGGRRFALDATVVRRFDPAPRIASTGFRTDTYLGAIVDRGQTLPVVDLARMLELAPHRQAADAVVLAELGGVPVGLAVTALAGLVTAGPDEILPFRGRTISPTGAADAVLQRRGADAGEAPTLLLDPARLAALPLLSTLTRLHAGLSAEVADRVAVAAARASFLEVTAGAAIHLPLRDTLEVLPAETPFSGGGGAMGAMLGMVETRQGVLPLYDLTWLVTQRLGAVSPRQRVVVIAMAGRPVALRVEHVADITHCVVRGQGGVEGLLCSLPVTLRGQPDSLAVLDAAALEARLAA